MWYILFTQIAIIVVRFMVSNQFLDIQLIRDIHLIPLRVSYKKPKTKSENSK